MTILTIDEIQQKVAPIAKKYNLKSVYLFASYTHGEAREDSDIVLNQPLSQEAIDFFNQIDNSDVELFKNSLYQKAISKSLEQKK